MSRSQSILVIIFSLLQYSCNRQQSEQIIATTNAPEKIRAISFSVSLDSLPPPEIFPVTNLKPVKAGKPKIVSIKSNQHALGKPRIVPAGNPVVCTPGKDTFKLPVKVPAIDSPFIAGLPDIVIAKDPQTRDKNPFGFSTFKILQGLEENIIFSLLPDSSGNLWIGTWRGGVSKYDGRTFTNYSIKQGLRSSMVSSILEDKKGNIWFGTQGGGVTRFDGRKFSNFSIQEGLLSDEVWSMYEDSSGNIWFGTAQGLSKFDGSAFTNYSKEQGISGVNVRGILKDKHGDLWFGSVGGGISKFDGNSFSNYTTREGLIDDRVEYMMKDSKGNIWICTLNGLCMFNGDSFFHYSTANGLASNIVVRIFEDSHGDLWIAYEEGGIDHLSGESVTNFNSEQGLSDDWVRCISADKYGTFWFGTGSGVSKYDGNLFSHITASQGLSSITVRSIFEDKQGNIWAGTYGGGVNRYDGKNIQVFTKDQGLSSNNIITILEDMHGQIWLTTFGSGVSKYNGTSFTNYSREQGLKSEWIVDFLKTRNGDLWFGTHDGIFMYDGKSFTQYTTSQGLSSNNIQCSIEDRAGNLWFGTIDGGVNKFDGNTFVHFNKKGGLINNWVIELFEDTKGNIWMGTPAGVSKYDGEYFTNYTTAQGLSHSFVNSIMEGNDGDLWFGTVNGISRMKTGDHRRTGDSGTSWFKNYTYADGFLGVGTWINSIIKDRKGNIWFGASDRITRYHPEGDIPDTIAPNIQLSGLLLFNQNISWPSLEGKKDTSLVLSNGVVVSDFKVGGISKWYNVPESLELAYNNNYLTFQFIGITLKKPQAVKYQYKLEGLDDYWSPINSKPEATYSDLPYGDYTFRVKAVNSEGYWSKEKKYSFTIQPPWWQSNWAYAVYGILFLQALFGIDRIQRQRVIEKEKAKAKARELEQAKEIEKAYHELKATQSQLIQSEKMASLGELTAGIAHEIQNPLNFVNNFSDVNTELLDEMEQDMQAGKLANAVKLSKDIRENERKINIHGKKADAIVKSMLQHSRTNSGIKEPTDINALADEYLRLAYHGLRAKDNSFQSALETSFDESIGQINVNPQDIGRVLLNVINNAFYAVSEKQKQYQAGYQPVVSVSTRKNNDIIEMRISDNGMGIPEKIKDKIFQPFFTTKPTGQGTGLGLSLSYDIIKAHGGELKVESKEGEGSEFIILLPTI